MADDNALILSGMRNIEAMVDKNTRSMEKVADHMQYIRGELIRNEEWHKVLNDQVGDIHDAVHGNGKPGLTSELKCIDDIVGDMNARLLEIEKRESKKNTLREASKLEWLRGWRALLFAGLTTLVTTLIALGLDHAIRH